MANVRFECTYCGHKFMKYLYSAESIDGLCCPICKDTRLKEESYSMEDKDPFGYRYDPKRGKK